MRKMKKGQEDSTSLFPFKNNSRISSFICILKEHDSKNMD